MLTTVRHYRKFRLGMKRNVMSLLKIVGDAKI
jgi:hypothetical protein